MAKTKDKKKEAEAPPVDGDGAEGEDTPKKKGLPVMLIAIAGAAVLVLGGGGTAAYFMFMKPKTPPAAEAGKADAHAKKDDKKKDKKKEGGEAAKVDPKTLPVIAEGPDGVTYFTLPDVVANIESPDGHASYLKLKLTFEVGDQETVDLLQESMPRVNDILQGFMGELRPEDLSSSAGDYQLRLEILRRINLVLAPHKINAVLIEEKLIT